MLHLSLPFTAAPAWRSCATAVRCIVAVGLSLALGQAFAQTYQDPVITSVTPGANGNAVLTYPGGLRATVSIASSTTDQLAIKNALPLTGNTLSTVGPVNSDYFDSATPSTPAIVLDTMSGGCPATTLCERGNLTVTFSEPTLNARHHVAGLGGRRYDTSLQASYWTALFPTVPSPTATTPGFSWRTTDGLEPSSGATLFARPWMANGSIPVSPTLNLLTCARPDPFDANIGCGTIFFVATAPVTVYTFRVRSLARVTDTSPSPWFADPVNTLPDTWAFTTTVIPRADLSVTQATLPAAQTTYARGATFNYTVTVNNLGPNSANGSVFRNATVAGLNVTGVTCGAVTGSAVCPTGLTPAAVNTGVAIPTLPPTGSLTFTLTGTYDAAASGTLTNVATVTPVTGVYEAVTTNNSASLAVNSAQMDVAVTQATVPAGQTTYIRGAAFTYMATVSNLGSNSANGTLFRDATVAGLNVTGVTCGAVTGSAVCPIPADLTPATLNTGVTLATLPPASSLTFTLTGTYGATASGTLTNVATVTAPAGLTEAVTTNNSASLAINPAPMDVAVTQATVPAGQTTFARGAAFTYTATVSNLGSNSANGTLFRDATVAGLNVTGVTCGAATGSAVCPIPADLTPATLNTGVTLATLPPASSLTFTLTGTYGATASGTLTNVATVTAPAGVTETVTTNNTSSLAVTLPSADVSAALSGPTFVTKAGAVRYVLTIQNAGPSAASGISYSVALTGTIISAGNVSTTTPLSATATCGAAGCAAPVQGSTVTGTIPTLPVGGSVQITLDATAPNGFPGSVDLVASVASPPSLNDTNLANNSATFQTNFEQSRLDVVLGLPSPPKQVGPTTFAVPVRIQIKNWGPNLAAPNVQIVNAMNSRFPNGTLSLTGPGAVAPTATPIAPATADACLLNPGYTGVGDGTNSTTIRTQGLLNGSKSLPVGGVCVINFTVLVTYPDPVAPALLASQSASLSARLISSAVPSGVGAVGTNTINSDNSTASLTLPASYSADAPGNTDTTMYPQFIDVVFNKVGLPIPTTTGVVSQSYKLIVKNTGEGEATFFQVEDNLTNPCIASSPKPIFSVPTPPTVTPAGGATLAQCARNPGFNGDSDIRLFTGTQNLPKGGSCTIEYQVRADYGNNANVPVTDQGRCAKASVHASTAGTLLDSDKSSPLPAPPATPHADTAADTVVNLGSEFANVMVAINPDTQTQYSPGGAFTYPVTVSAVGPISGNGSVLSSAAVTYVGVSSVSCDSATGGAVCPTSLTVASLRSGITLATLPPGGTMVFRLQGTYGSAASGTLTTVATITPPAGRIDSITADNTGSVAVTQAPITALPTADLSAAMTGPTRVLKGGALRYVLTIQNAGPAAANAATYTDTLPTGVTNITAVCEVVAGGATCATPTVDNVTRMVSGSVPTLPSGGVVKITLNAEAPKPATPASITNSASVTGPITVTEINTGNNTTAPVNTAVDQNNIDLVFDLNGSPLQVGPTSFVVPFKLQLKNWGPLDAPNLQIANALSDGFGGATLSLTGTGAVAPSSSVVAPASPPNCDLNPAFTGIGTSGVSVNLLDGRQSLPVNGGCVVTYSVLVTYPTPVAPATLTAGLISLGSRAVSTLAPPSGAGLMGSGNVGSDNANKSPTLPASMKGDGETKTEFTLNPQYIDVVLNHVGAVTPATTGVVNLPYQLVVKNTGTGVATFFQVEDNLAAAFPDGSPAPVITLPTAPTVVPAGGATAAQCAINPGFNGVSNIKLFSGTQNLPAGGSCAVTLNVRLSYGSVGNVPGTSQINSAKASVYMALNGILLDSDVSTTGTTPPSTPHGDTPSGTHVNLAGQFVDVITSIGTVTQTDKTQFEVPLDLSVKNTGNIAATFFQVVANAAAGLASGTPTISLVGAPTVTPIGAASTSCTLNAGYNATSTANLFSGQSTLAVGAGCRVQMTLRVRYATRAAIPLTNQTFSATASTYLSGAGAPGGTGSGLSDSDLSTHATALPSQPSGDSPAATSFKLAPQNLLITMSHPGTAVPSAPAFVDLNYIVAVKNDGTLPATFFQVTDDLKAVFPTASTITLPTAPAVTAAGGATAAQCARNPGYNGDTDTKLFSGTQTLPVNGTCTITVKVRLDYGTPAAVPLTAQNNTATVSSYNALGGTELFTAQSSNSVTLASIPLPPPPPPPPPTPVPTPEPTPPPVPVPTPTPVSLQGQAIDVTNSVSGHIVQTGEFEFEIPLRITLRNTGSVPATNFQVVDNFAASFGAGSPTISFARPPETVLPLAPGVAPGVAPVVAAGVAPAVAPAVTADCTLNSGFTGTGPPGSPSLNLFSGQESLPVGASCVVNFTLRLVYVSLAAVPGVAQFNSVQAYTFITAPASAGDLGTGVAQSDVSTNGDTPPLLANGDAPSATVVYLGTAAIDVIKVKHGSEIEINDHTFTMPYRIAVKNTGTVTAAAFQAVEDLGVTFAEGTPLVTVPHAPTVTASGGASAAQCALNPGFNGTTQVNLFDGRQPLPAGGTCTVLLTAEVMYASVADVPATDQNNTVTASIYAGPAATQGGIGVGLLMSDDSTNTGSLPLSAGGDAASATPANFPPPALVTTPLYISKSADRRTVEIGDTVRYAITIKQVVGQETGLAEVDVIDHIPFGFTYIKGTSSYTVNGQNLQVIADPAGSPRGPTLRFKLGAMEASDVIVLRYRLRADVGSAQGDGINRARATVNALDTCEAQNDAMCSNEARYQVIVSQGVFTNDACIVGRVFVDCNNNGMQDGSADQLSPSEPGVAGVRMYFENGDFLISDREGKFSACGLRPMTHVLALDRSTLPRGAQMKVSSNRNAANANSLFVDLRNGDMQHVDFIEGSCSASVLERVRQRRARGDVTGAQIDQPEAGSK